MADTGKQSPLGVNVLGSLLAGHDITSNNTTFYINPVAQSYYGKSKSNADYEPGKIVNETCLKWITYALSNAWGKTPMASGSPTITAATYDFMLNIGQSRLPALANSKPPTYQVDDPTEFWTEKGGPANTGFAIDSNIDHGQQASWDPWDSGDPAGSNPNSEVTKWGWIRALALQAYNEFWYNAKITYPTPGDYSVGIIEDNPSYKDFTSNFLSCDGFIDYSNEAIYAVQNSQTFLQGTFSNQDDLSSADISGISLSARAFGQDLINLGRVIELEFISGFGLPSNLLKTLQMNKAMTQPVILACLSSGLSQTEITDIANGIVTANKDQEQKLYGAFLVVVGTDLLTILKTLNCKTKNIEKLSDLLSIKKIFPLSYRTLTVPVYNTEPGPTNSKTYYLLFIDDALNPQLVIPRIRQTVGVISPPVEPPLPLPPEPALPVVEQPVVEIPTPIVLPPPAPIPDPAPVIVPPPPTPAIPAPPAPPQPTGGGGCVALESFVPLVEVDQKHNGREITKVWMLETGMKISLGTDDLQIVDGQVIKTLNDHQPCVRISTADGITLICSTTAPIFTRDKGFIPATEVYGKRVAVMRNGKTWFDEVVGLEDVGMKFVRVIDAGNNSFWAGERPGSFILHHNVPINDKYNYDKK